MSFKPVGTFRVQLEDMAGGYLEVVPLPVDTWTEDEFGVWRGSSVQFPPVEGLGWGSVAGFCVIDEQGFKIGPSCRFGDGPWVAYPGDDLLVFPSIEFVKEYA